MILVPWTRQFPPQMPGVETILANFVVVDLARDVRVMALPGCIIPSSKETINAILYSWFGTGAREGSPVSLRGLCAA